MTNSLQWNTTYKEQVYSLWYNRLTLDAGRWRLAGSLHNVAHGLPIEAPFGMYDTFDSLSNFDVCDKGIAFTARDLGRTTLDSEHVSLPFFAYVESFSSPVAQEPNRIALPETVGVGSSTNIRFSPDNSLIAFLVDPNDDPCNKRILSCKFDDSASVGVSEIIGGICEGGQEPVESFEFSSDSVSFIIQKQHLGQNALFQLSCGGGEEQRHLVTCGHISAFYELQVGDDTALLVSSSSFIDSSLWQLVNVSTGEIMSTVSSLTNHGSMFGLSRKMVADFWYVAENGIKVHSWMLRPPEFDPEKSYPWILLPHGGPESAWVDSWSTRVSVYFTLLWLVTQTDRRLVEYRLLCSARLRCRLSQHCW